MKDVTTEQADLHICVMNKSHNQLRDIRELRFLYIGVMTIVSYCYRKQITNRSSESIELLSDNSYPIPGILYVTVRSMNF